MDTLVECYSGHEYPERPSAIYWEGVRCPIKKVIAEWRTPLGKIFRVQVLNGCCFELVYEQDFDTWKINAI
jgi:hypothetical protein